MAADWWKRAMPDKKQGDLVDAGSEYSFPASDPPSFMGGTATAGRLPAESLPGTGVCTEVSDPDAVKPAHDAPQGTDPARVERPEAQVRTRSNGGREPASGSPGAAQSAVEGRSHGTEQAGGSRGQPPPPIPPAGPHADPALMNELSTPGTGALTPVGAHGDVDSTSS